MRALLIAGLLAAAPAFAGDALIFKNDAVSIRLTQEPCEPPVADLIREELRPSVKRADVVFQGNALRACWLERNGHAEIADETGDGGRVPMSAFKVENGV